LILILGFFTLTLAAEEKNLIAPDLIKEFKKEGIFTFAAAAIFFASILPVFAIPLRYYLWIIPLIILSVRRRLSRKKV